jgi:hypothetical protein
MTETSTISNGTGSPVSIAEVVTGQIVDLSGTGMALFSDLEPTESCSFAFVNKISYKGTVVFDGTERTETFEGDPRAPTGFGSWGVV